MVPHACILPYDRSLRYVNIAAFADLHVGSKEFSRRHFREWRDENLKDPFTYFLAVGDLIEAIGPFDPRFTLDSVDPRHYGKQGIIDAQEDDLCSELEPIAQAGKLIGVMMGNHEERVLNRTGHDPTKNIAEKLGVKNLGMSCHIHCTLRPISNGDGRIGGSRVVKIYAHHGWGGGTRTRGGDMTKVSRKPTEYVADIFFFAHSHQAWDDPHARLDITPSAKTFDRDYIIVNTGTFKRGISAGPIPTYEERSGFGPQKLGGRVVEIKVDTHKWVEFRKI